MSVPSSIWRSTIHPTAFGKRRAYSAWSAPWVLRPPSMSSSSSGGRGRLPAWETRIRSVLGLIRFLPLKSIPEPLARPARPLDEGLELRFDDRRRYPLGRLALGEPAVGAGDHVLAPDYGGIALDALGNELRVLHREGVVGDDARD